MRSYNRKTERKICTEEMLKTAHELLEAGMSKRKTANQLGISEAALRKRLLKGVGAKSLGRFNPVFNDELEAELVQHVKKLDECFYGLSLKNLRRLAFRFAEANQISHPFNTNLKLAGLDWAESFLKKHNLSLRTPSKTSLARISGFNKTQVDVFFTNLEELMKKFKFPASRIWNMDESSTSTVPNKTPKVVSVLGKKGVGKVSSAERGTTSTVICTMSASGNYVPPVIIFARKRMKPELMNGAPPDSIMLCSDSGYSNSDLFTVWLKHFQKHVVSSESNPVLLILDNHGSHISIESVLFCRQHSIHLLSIPPHSSHKIQPLDKVFFKPLKDYLSEMSDNWLLNHPGRVITSYQIAEIFGQAYEKTATMGKGLKGFEVCGIFPVNRNIFSDDDFLPSAVTDQPMAVDNPDDNVGLPEQTMSSEQNVADVRSPGQADSSVGGPNRGVINKEVNTPVRDHKIKQWTSPADVLPLPKRKEAQIRKSKKQKSEILTSSPFKDQLVAAEEKKRQTEEDRLKKLEVKQKKLDFMSVKKPKGKLNFNKPSRPTSTDTVVTSSPDQLLLVADKKKKQAGENQSKKLETKIIKVEFTSVEKHKRKRTLDQPGTSTDKITCPACAEEFKEPPEEDWIQCTACREWWHEDCSNYDGGVNFICDYC